MGDKIANALIVIILIIIIGLGGVYFYKFGGIECISNIIGQSSSKEEESIIQNTNDITEEELQKRESLNIVIPNVNENNTILNTTQNITANTSINMTTNTIPTTNASTSQDISANSTITNYKYNDHYYYNQLDQYSKAIYDTIEKNLENLKTGIYTINIDYDFSELLKQSNGEAKLNNYYGDAINAINLDIPSLFYINLSKMSLNVETTTNLFGSKYRLYIDAGNNTNYFADGFSSELEVENAIKEVETVKQTICSKIIGTDYSKIAAAHDWIVDNLEYVSSNNSKGTIYGALIEKQAVCEGYSRAYKYILDELGITNILVTGTATNSNGDTEEHMWNYIKLNDMWFAVDVTWDDPIISGGGNPTSEMKRRYFMIGSNELFENHIEKRTISTSGKTFELPTISKGKY